MIESKIYNWVDLGDSMQLLDVYSKKHLTFFFKVFYLLLSYRNYSVLFLIILKIIIFIQIMILSIINVSPDNDFTLQIVYPLSRIFLLHDEVDSTKKIIITMFLITAYIITIASILIYIIYCIKKKKTPHIFPMEIINLCNEALFSFFIGPFGNIFLLSISCKNGLHIILKVACYKDWLHLVILSFSMFYFVILLLYTLLLSIYCTQINSLRNANSLRNNCNFELYFTITKMAMFIVLFCTKHFFITLPFVISYQLMLFLFEFILVIYIQKQVLYYNMTLNYVNKCGWMFVCWFSFVLMAKLLISIKDITIFLILGWLIIGFFNYFYEQYQIQFSLTKLNIFEVKSLQPIEYYVTRLLNYKDTYDIKIKMLMKGVITRFENWLQTSNNEKLEKYTKIAQNSHLTSRINNQLSIPIISMIYIIYEHHLEKSTIKTDIFLVLSYFLIKHMKNWVYVISLCSKIKVTNHKDLYLKYCLTEEIKEMLTMKMIKGINHSKDSIKHIDISSVILYDYYIDSFKLKIYDAACNQIEYFDILRNNTTTNKTMLSLIKVGKNIISLRLEITELWNKINELNPFSVENEKDYTLYLETVIQDIEQANQEEKRHHTNLINLFSEKNNLYHSLFIKEQTAILLIEGYSSNNRVIYTTPNYSEMFNYPNKEVLNTSINDFIPKPVSSFHSELIQEGVKYINLQSKFPNQRDFLLKGKTGGIFSIKAYIKTIPNLSFGLVYIASITKQQERNFIIVLDKDLKVCGLSDILSQGGGIGVTVNNNYGLSESLCGQHIALILPEILLHMRYKNQRFTIKKKEIDLKGNLYPGPQFKGLDDKIERVLDRIKQYGKLKCEDTDENNDSKFEYKDLVTELEAKYPHPFSIFYKITLRSFLNDKYQYYRVYITKDLISVNELSPMGNNSYSNNNESNSKYKDGAMRKDNNIGFLMETNTNKIGHKEIKLNMFNKFSENKQLLEKRKIGQDDNSYNNNDKKDNQSKQKEAIDLNNNSLQKPKIKLTPEYTAFRMIKQGILNKTELIQSQQMKFVTLTYAIMSMGLMLTNYFLIDNSFDEINEFLYQNTFFNKSNIVSASLYINGINLKMIKYDFYSESNPICIEKCSKLYSTQLKESIDEFKTLKENNSYFFEDYKEIFNTTHNVTIQVYKPGVFDETTMDVNNLINAIIANGLMFIPNLEKYLKDKPSIYDVNCANVIDISFVYFQTEQIIGFNETILEDKVKARRPSIICMIIQLVIFAIAIVCLAFVIINMISIEQSLLKKLIRYQSASFDMYIKRLEELKKKLHNEAGEDDDKFNDDRNDESKSSKDNDDDDESNKDSINNNNKKQKKDGSNTDNINKNKENSKSRKGGKHQRNKQAKLQQKQNEKIVMMSNFFYKYNLIFSFKVVAVFIISLSYYLVAMLLNEERILNTINLDNSMNAILAIFNQSYTLFLIYKMYLFNYANYEIEKINGIEELIGGASNYTINGVVFTTIEDIQNSFYTFEFPDVGGFFIPKIGNLLISLINYAESNSVGVRNLNTLFNDNACELLTEENSPQYDQCSMFWSSILIKGLDQSITQMGVVLNTVLDHVLQLSSGEMTIHEIFAPNSPFSQIDFFMNFYLYPAFKDTVFYFAQIRDESIYAINTMLLGISIGFVGAEFVLLIIVINIVHSSKEVFNAFLNFIAIFPYQYLMEDDNIISDFEALEKKLFHL